MATLTSESSSVDRSGAAQGLAEVLGGMGVQRLEAILPDFIKTAESTRIQPYVRDGYLMLFIYLPEVFSSEFARFIHSILSPILKVNAFIFWILFFIAKSLSVSELELLDKLRLPYKSPAQYS